MMAHQLMQQVASSTSARAGSDLSAQTESSAIKVVAAVPAVSLQSMPSVSTPASHSDVVTYHSTETSLLYIHDHSSLLLVHKNFLVSVYLISLLPLTP